MAGTIGLVQNDIKRVLAYSTVSQLGYMFLAMGVGAFGAGIFHLYTHAFFKALLFLGSGAVIHALAGEQDIRNMGGLRKGLPITYWTFLIGAIAIAGVPPLAGFFSKDEILWKTFAGGHRIMWIIGLVTSFLTATYMFRLVFLTFHGERRHDAPAAAAHSAQDHEEPAAHGSPWPCGSRPWPPSCTMLLRRHGARADRAGDRIGRSPVWSASRTRSAGTTRSRRSSSRRSRRTRWRPTTEFQDQRAAPGRRSRPQRRTNRRPSDHAEVQTERMLMALSSGIALAGIGLAWSTSGCATARPRTGVARRRDADLHAAPAQQILTWTRSTTR